MLTQSLHTNGIDHRYNFQINAPIVSNTNQNKPPMNFISLSQCWNNKHSFINILISFMIY